MHQKQDIAFSARSRETLNPKLGSDLISSTSCNRFWPEAQVVSDELNMISTEYSQTGGALKSSSLLVTDRRWYVWNSTDLLQSAHGADTSEHEAF